MTSAKDGKMSHSQFALLKTRRFAPLFVAQFLGAFNDNVFRNALVMLITFYAAEKVSMDPRILVTAAAGIFMLPFFLFSALAGQIVDASEKSAYIRRLKKIEIGLMLVAALGFYLQSVSLLMVVLFLMGTQSAFFGPVKYSILPDHLHEDELIGGNAIVEAGTFLSILLGTIIGGILIMREGGMEIVSAIVVAMAALGYFSSRYIPAAKAAAPDLKVSYNIFTETWKIVRHAAGNKDVFLSIIGISWFWLVGFVFLSQFPVYGKDVIGGNEMIVTLFLTTFSIGIAVGSLLCEKLLKGEVSGVYVPVGAFGMTAAILLLWLVSPNGTAVVGGELIGIMEFLSNPQYCAVLFAMLLVSVFGGIYIVPLYAIMQSRADKAHRSRTIAANNILNALFMVASSLLAMLMLSLNMRVVDIFLTVGIVNIPVGFLVRRIVKKRRAANEEINKMLSAPKAKKRKSAGAPPKSAKRRKKS